MKQMISKLYHNDIVRYVFFGGLTTLVNLVSFWLLRQFTAMNLNIVNFISIILAITFAFITNSKYVFASGAKGAGYLREFGKFIGARAATMVIEMGGVPLLALLFGNEYVAKLLAQVVVMVLNYVFSKFWVFSKKETSPSEE